MGTRDPASLAHSEPDVYLGDMNSYGRAARFLALTGHERAGSLVASPLGGQALAKRVELAPPAAKAGSGTGLFDTATGSAESELGNPGPADRHVVALAHGR